MPTSRSTRWTGSLEKSSILRLVDQCGHRLRVRQRPAEGDLDVYDLRESSGDDLGVPELIAVRGTALVGNKYVVSVGRHTDESEAGNPLAVGPTARKVRRSIDVVVQRAGEVEVSSNQRFNRCAILLYIRLVAGQSSADWVVRHSGDFRIKRVGKANGRCAYAAVHRRQLWVGQSAKAVVSCRPAATWNDDCQSQV